MDKPRFTVLPAGAEASEGVKLALQDANLQRVIRHIDGSSDPEAVSLVRPASAVGEMQRQICGIIIALL